MAIPVLNSQGTVLWILDAATAATITGTPITDIPIIQSGDVVGCPQSIGTIEETRTVTSYKCMSSNETAKAFGAIERGNMEIGLLFDPDDAAGQLALKTAFGDNTLIGVGIEFPDADVTLGTTGASGTILYFEGGISAVSVGIEQDSAVTYTVTIEISSEVTEYAMVAGTA